MCEAKETSIRFICVIVFGFGIAIAIAVVVAVVVVNQSSPTVIWSIDRYNEHWYAWQMQLYRTIDELV